MKSDVRPDIEADSYRRQDLRRIADDHDAYSVHEVRFGRRSLWGGVIRLAILALLVFFGVRLVLQTADVQGTSMEPTLHDGQRLLISKAAYYKWETNFLDRLNPFQESTRPDPKMDYLFGPPKRGDLVLFTPPNDPRAFIKRVIGLPGESVEIKPNDGVYIAGKKLDEPYVKDTPDYSVNDAQIGKAVPIPDGSIFVLGDNRRESIDSHSFGPVRIDSVIGRVWP